MIQSGGKFPFEVEIQSWCQADDETEAIELQIHWQPINKTRVRLSDIVAKVSMTKTWHVHTQQKMELVKRIKKGQKEWIRTK